MEDNAKKICLFGPQGSGKGTQAERLSEYFGIPHVSTGNMFRQAIAAKTETGKKIEEMYKQGKLMSDELTNQLVQERLEQEDCLEGFIFDGYPRNMAQSEALDGMTTLTHAVVIEVPEEESIRRLSQRWICTTCNITYHLEVKPPKVADTCDVCGKALTQRPDDQPEAIRERLHIYETETKPMLARYEERGILHRVDGTGSIDGVWNRVLEIFSDEQ